MSIEKFYTELKKHKIQARYQKKEEWLLSKIEEIREFIERLKERGESLDMDKLVAAINLMAEQDGLRKRKKVQVKKGEKLVYEGIKFHRKFVERVLREHGII